MAALLYKHAAAIPNQTIKLYWKHAVTSLFRYLVFEHLWTLGSSGNVDYKCHHVRHDLCIDRMGPLRLPMRSLSLCASRVVFTFTLICFLEISYLPLDILREFSLICKLWFDVVTHGIHRFFRIGQYREVTMGKISSTLLHGPPLYSPIQGYFNMWRIELQVLLWKVDIVDRAPMASESGLEDRWFPSFWLR